MPQKRGKIKYGFQNAFATICFSICCFHQKCRKSSFQLMPCSPVTNISCIFCSFSNLLLPAFGIMSFLFHFTIDSYIPKILKTSLMYIICNLHKGTKENKNGRIVSWNYDPAKVFLQRAITIIYSQHHPFDTIFFPKYENSFCFI